MAKLANQDRTRIDGRPMASNQLWSPTEIAEIMRDSDEILADQSLLVLSDGRPVRAPGHWELMRLDQRKLVLAGDVTF